MKRWNIPGVHYPDEQPAKPRRQRCDTVAEAPAGYITKEQAAVILGCSRPATAAQYLREHKVQTIKTSLRRYYCICDVYALSRKIPREIPAGYISTEESVRIIGLCRSSLQSHAYKGEINSCYYINDQGKRCSAYNEQDVRDLAQYLNYKLNKPTQK